MGLCMSISAYEDEDDRMMKEKRKQQAKELYEFRKQLHKGHCEFSELDLSGKGKSRSSKTK